MQPSLVTPLPRATRLVPPSECREAMSRRGTPRGSRRAPRAGGGAVAFTPAALPNLDWWWDATDNASLSIVSTTQVASITDKSANAFVATGGSGAGGGASNPTKATGINGTTTIHFNDASGQWFDLPNRFGSFTGYEVWVVRIIPLDTPVAGNSFWQFGSSGSACFVPFTDRGIYDDFGTTVRQTFGAPSAGVWSAAHVYQVVSAGGTLSVSVNNVAVGSPIASTVGWTTTPRFGSTGLTTFWLGDIGEVVGVKNGAMSAGSRTSLYAYLKPKWGLP